MDTEKFDLVVIGAGAAGLTAAGGAAMFGLSVALIEAGKMGGECLHTGCVPSKALIAAASRAHQGRGGAQLGIDLGEPRVDWAGVRAHVDGAIAGIAANDSAERFEAMGVEVIRTRARFLDRTTVLAGNRRLRAPRIVIATGSRPKSPDLPGLSDVPYLTNETLFGLELLPDHLLVLGGGPIGCEMAQAFRRLGSQVTVVAPELPLARDDPDASAIVAEQLRREGVTFEPCSAIRVASSAGSLALTLEDSRLLTGSHLLVAIGRDANVEGLDLAAAGVEAGPDGIVVDARRRTSNRRIYAIGDCRAGPRFTHVSGYEGSLVALDVALGWPGKVDWCALPRVTYTDPELAQVGLTEAEARGRHGAIEVVRQDFAHNDRAVAEGDTRGFLKLIRYRGRVVGVTIVGARAGELLLPWTQIMTGKSSMFALGSAVIAYPTRSEIAKAAAFAALEPQVFGAWPKRWARTVARARSWRI
jgi:pyruvate/2-oxoglutarate dehydrogenase complex dihydrolipoamide dehydrogenase (E3) component